MKKLILPALFLTFTLPAIAQTDKGPTAKSGTTWMSFRDSAFQILYPSNWTLDRSGMMGTRFILFSPQESDSDEFKENVNLNITDLGAPDIVNLDLFAKAAQEQITNMITDAEVVRTERIRRGPGEFNDYYLVEFTGKQGKLSLHWQQRYWIKGRNAFILTFTAHHMAYERFQEVAESVMGSFALR